MRRPWVKLQAFSWPAAFALFALFAFFGEDSFPLAAAMLCYLGGTGALGNIELNTYLAQQVDNGMLARVTGICRMLTVAACAVGWVLGGWLAQHNEGVAISVLVLLVLPLPVLAFRRSSSDAAALG